MDKYFYTTFYQRYDYLTATLLSWISGDVTFVATDSSWKNIADTKQWRHRLKSMLPDIWETM